MRTMVMKKQYVKPEIMEVEVAISFMLAASFTIYNLQGECEEDFAKERRGVWGDLWTDSNNILN